MHHCELRDCVDQSPESHKYPKPTVERSKKENQEGRLGNRSRYKAKPPGYVAHRPRKHTLAWRVDKKNEVRSGYRIRTLSRSQAMPQAEWHPEPESYQEKGGDV